MTLHLHPAVRAVHRCSLLEDDLEALPLAGQALRLDLRNYEIATLRLEIG